MCGRSSHRRDSNSWTTIVKCVKNLGAVRLANACTGSKNWQPFCTDCVARIFIKQKLIAAAKLWIILSVLKYGYQCVLSATMHFNCEARVHVCCSSLFTTPPVGTVNHSQMETDRVTLTLLRLKLLFVLLVQLMVYFSSIGSTKLHDSLVTRSWIIDYRGLPHALCVYRSMSAVADQYWGDHCTLHFNGLLPTLYKESPLTTTHQHH